MQQVVIIGGGLSGLTAALQLIACGIPVTVIEKKEYPFHRVCGEYISNEVLPFLKSLSICIQDLAPAHITKLQVSAPSGKNIQAELGLGGFGISRYTLDEHLYKKAEKAGVQFMLKTAVTDVCFSPVSDDFSITLSNGQIIKSKIVLGSYGKRSNLDRSLNRAFFTNRSPYIGVKYHLNFDMPRNRIALHNFKDGYAGISAIENNKYCFCYLTTRQNLKNWGSIQNLENTILKQNPFLKDIFENATFLYDKPEVINEISFAPKQAVENHILMSGDAAGMITPLCGNGMAMAIHGAKLASDQIREYFNTHQNRHLLEKQYSLSWKNQFSKRLAAGRIIQSMFGNKLLTETVIMALNQFPKAVNFLIGQTHGKPF